MDLPSGEKIPGSLRWGLDAAAVVERLLARGVRMGAVGPRTIRAVTHLDVSAEQIERALVAARAVLAG